MIDELSVRVNKITSGIGLSWTHSLLFCFLPIFNWWIMTILLKGCKPDYFESHNTVKRSFTSTQGLCSKFVEWIFLRIKFSWHSSLCKTNLDDFWQFFCEGVSSFDSKGFHYSYECSCNLCEGHFCTWKLCRFLLMFSTGFTSLCLTSFSSINHPLCLYPQFYVLLFNIN